MQSISLKTLVKSVVKGIPENLKDCNTRPERHEYVIGKQHPDGSCERKKITIDLVEENNKNLSSLNFDLELNVDGKPVILKMRFKCDKTYFIANELYTGTEFALLAGELKIRYSVPLAVMYCTLKQLSGRTDLECFVEAINLIGLFSDFTVKVSDRCCVDYVSNTISLSERIYGSTLPEITIQHIIKLTRSATVYSTLDSLRVPALIYNKVPDVRIDSLQCELLDWFIVVPNPDSINIEYNIIKFKDSSYSVFRRYFNSDIEVNKLGESGEDNSEELKQTIIKLNNLIGGMQ